jgi:GH15 family glucan-1,4-alpha-glucosidase
LMLRWETDDTSSDVAAALETLEETIESWHAWLYKPEATGSREWAGDWHDLVLRSELALKLLVHANTGAVAAAATTSIPETIGGVRNWDYRYSWIRDAALAVQALGALGHREEGNDFLHWAERVSEQHMREKQDLQIMYTLHGKPDLAEFELGHLEGYRGSRPVRFGNAAADQRQLDIYGELLTSAYELDRQDIELEADIWSFLSTTTDRACQIWEEEDDGIWEQRNGPRHYVYSKVMVWMALDRAIHLVSDGKMEGHVEHWKRSRDQVGKDILDRGYDEELGAFIQAYDRPDLDASNLLIPLQEFLPFDDLRVQGTIDATLDHLTENGLVYRYLNDDGLPGKEGAFGLCTFWLVDALALSGRIEEAREIFEGIGHRANHVGLYSEQIDPASGEFLGNLPQAFTHLGFINSRLYLAHAEGDKIPGPPLIGTPEHRRSLGHPVSVGEEGNGTG